MKKKVKGKRGVVDIWYAAKKAGLSKGHLARLCRTGHVKGAYKVGRPWKIPLNSEGLPEIIGVKRHSPHRKRRKNGSPRKRVQQTIVNSEWKTMTYKDRWESLKQILVKRASELGATHALMENSQFDNLTDIQRTMEKTLLVSSEIQSFEILRVQREMSILEDVGGEWSAQLSLPANT